MSAQYRTEQVKLIDKYCRTFGVTVDDIETGEKLLNGSWDWCVWSAKDPTLPAWGMGADDRTWEDGPTQDKPRWATRPPKTVLVSRRKR